MKYLKKRRFRRSLVVPLAAFSLAYLINGCSWDNTLYDRYVVDHDLVSCPPADESTATLDAIYFADGKSITSENTVHDETDYATAFEAGICPAIAPTCVKTPNGEYVCTPCKEGQQLCHGVCINYIATHVDACDSEASDTAIQCANGYNDCDNDPKNGCEYDLNASNALSCINNSVNCLPGYSNCDNEINNGCEYELASHEAFCQVLF